MHKYDPEWILNAIPKTENGFDSCERYAPLDYNSNGTLTYCPATLFNQSKTVNCEGFVYAKNNTVVYEVSICF